MRPTTYQLMLRWLRTLAAFGLIQVGACAVPDRGDPPEPDATAEVKSDTTATHEATTGEVSTAEATGETDNEGVSETVEEVVEETAQPPVSFAESIHPILMANCTAAGCHAAGAGGFNVTGDVDVDYGACLDRVVPGNAEGSKLLKKSTATSSHQGGPVIAIGSPEYDLLVRWINDGAEP